MFADLNGVLTTGKITSYIKNKCRQLGLSHEYCSYSIRRTTNPIVYYSDQETFREILSRIQSALQQIPPSFDTNILTNWGQAKSYVQLGIQKSGSDNLVKRSYLGQELFMRVVIPTDRDERGSIKVTADYATSIGVTEEELWRAAIQNTAKRFTVHSLSEVLGLSDNQGNGLHVVTSDEIYDGAVSLYFPEVFQAFCDRQDVKKLFILPSSTQEVLIIPQSFAGENHVDDLARMVNEINHQQVDPILQLAPVVYTYTSGDNTIVIAAKAEV